MSTDLMEMPDTKELDSRVAIAIRTAESFVIDSDESYRAANAVRADIKKRREEVADAFGELCRKADHAHKAACAARDKYDKPLKAAEAVMKRKMGVHYQEQQNKARMERLRLEAIAHKQEEDRRLAEAEQLESEGRGVEAEQMLAEPIVTAVAPVPEAPKLDGISMRKTYSFKIVDATKIPRAYMKIDETLIGQVVRRQHEAAEAMIPGIKVTVTTSVAAQAGGAR